MEDSGTVRHGMTVRKRPVQALLSKLLKDIDSAPIARETREHLTALTRSTLEEVEAADEDKVVEHGGVRIKGFEALWALQRYMNALDLYVRTGGLPYRDKRYAVRLMKQVDQYSLLDRAFECVIPAIADDVMPMAVVYFVIVLTLASLGRVRNYV